MTDLPKDSVSRVHEMLVSLFDHLGHPNVGEWHQNLRDKGFEVIWSKNLIEAIKAERTDRLVIPDPNPFNYDHETEQRSVLLVPHNIAFKILALGCLP